MQKSGTSCSFSDMNGKSQEAVHTCPHDGFFFFFFFYHNYLNQGGHIPRQMEHRGFICFAPLFSIRSTYLVSHITSPQDLRENFTSTMTNRVTTSLSTVFLCYSIWLLLTVGFSICGTKMTVPFESRHFLHLPWVFLVFVRSRHPPAPKASLRCWWAGTQRRNLAIILSGPELSLERADFCVRRRKMPLDVKKKKSNKRKWMSFLQQRRSKKNRWAGTYEACATARHLGDNHHLSVTAPRLPVFPPQPFTLSCIRRRKEGERKEPAAGRSHPGLAGEVTSSPASTRPEKLPCFKDAIYVYLRREDRQFCCHW